MFCTTCGTANSDEARFCHSCGRAITAPPGEAVVIHRDAPSPRVAFAGPIAHPMPPGPTYAGAPPPAYHAPQTHVHVNQQVQVTPAAIMYGAPKSVALAIILAFFFGPLGLFYASVAGGFVMLVAGLLFAIATGGTGAVLVWIGSMIWAGVAASNHNNALMASRQIYIQNNRPY